MTNYKKNITDVTNIPQKINICVKYIFTVYVLKVPLYSYIQYYNQLYNAIYIKKLN